MSDETATPPKPRRAFLARAKLGWGGTLIAVTNIGFAAVWAEMLNNDISSQPWTMPGIYIFKILFALGVFGFNMIYWEPTAMTRRMIKNEGGELVMEGQPSYAKRLDREIRAYGDQAVSTIDLCFSVFLAIWFTIFYSRNGLDVFQPIRPGFDSRDINNFFQVKWMQIASLAISAMSIFICLAVSIYSDLFYKYMMAVARGDSEPLAPSGGGGGDLMSNTNTSTLSGNTQRKH